MFGLGMSEMIIIGLVILIFVNPKDLPKFVYHVGKIYGQLMDSYQAMTRQIREMGDEARREIEKAKYEAEAALKVETESSNPTSATTPEAPAPSVDEKVTVTVPGKKKRVVKKAGRPPSKKTKAAGKTRRSR